MSHNGIVLAAICLMVYLPASGMAESSFADFEASDKKVSEEVAKFLDVLNGEDAGRAVRALQYMLASDNNELVRAAKEFGLFSPNADVKAATLRAILDQSGPLKLQFDLSVIPDKDSNMIKYIRYVKGGVSTDEQLGSYIFSLGEHSAEKDCWVFKSSTNKCALRLAGTTVALSDGWRYLAGSLSLNAEGNLEGAVAYTGKSVPTTISLLD